MADSEQLAIVKSGVWNTWRAAHPDKHVDLSRADLSRVFYFIGAAFSGVDLSRANLFGVAFGEADLSGADLSGANLNRANLNRANLSGAILRGADLGGAVFSEANLRGADLSGANLREADLSGVDLSEAILKSAVLNRAHLVDADFSGADLSGVILLEAIFGNTDLTSAKGLEPVGHDGPSTLDHRTLVKSGPLPLVFLRGVGLPDRLIEYLPSLLGEAIQFYACFISYSSQDQVFAERLHNDLQGAGVRCWFAPKNLKPGDFFRAEIDRAIHVYDKLLLILSEHSITSAWVADEVEAALERERKTGQQVLFPIQIDDAVKNAGVENG